MEKEKKEVNHTQYNFSTEDKCKQPIIESDLRDLTEIERRLRAEGFKVSVGSNFLLTQCPIPTHGSDGHDENPSLQITLKETKKGARLCFRCYVGCPENEVREYFLSLLNILPIKEHDGVTLHDLTFGDEKFIEFCRELGIIEVPNGREQTAVAFPFTTPQGETYYQFRIMLKGKNKYRWQTGGSASESIFGLKDALRLVNKVGVNRLFVTESAMDAATLMYLGFPAVAAAGKENIPPVLRKYIGFIPKNYHILLWLEPDANNIVNKVVEACSEHELSIVRAENEELKDAWRILKHLGDKTKATEYIEQLIRKAISVRKIHREKRTTTDYIAFRSGNGDLSPIVERLRSLGREVKNEKTENGRVVSFLTQCPAHDDEHPSLSVSLSDSRLLVHCFAGCPQDVAYRTFCELVGITIGDGNGKGVTLRDLTFGDDDLADTFCRLGVREREIKGKSAVSFPMVAPNSSVYYHNRIALTGKEKWLLDAGAPAGSLIFGLDEALKLAKEAGILFVTESPVDAAVLIHLGLPAIGCVGKNNLLSALNEWLSSIPEELTLIVWLEPDAHNLREELAKILVNRRVYALCVTDQENKDAWRLVRNYGIDRAKEQLMFWLKTQCIPTPTPITDPKELVSELEKFIRDYVVLSDSQALITAIWALHTFLIDRFSVTPYLAITSPEKGSGKTRLLEVLYCITNNPNMSQLSPAALFRKIEETKGKITYLIDEVEHWLNDAEERQELKGFLNMGYRKGQTVSRVINKEGKTSDFPVFCPKALSGLGKLADTLADRTIPIILKKKLPDERTKNFELDRAREEAASLRLSAKLLASNADFVRLLNSIDIAPTEYFREHDRQWELSKPLLTIAAAIDLVSTFGENAQWESVDTSQCPYELTKRLCRALIKAFSENESAISPQVKVLKVFRMMFDETEKEELSTQEVFEKWSEFAQLVDAPIPQEYQRWMKDWENSTSEKIRQEAITAFGRFVSRYLSPFGIKSMLIGDKDDRHRGWRRKQFDEAWQRYLREGWQANDNDETLTISIKIVSHSLPDEILNAINSKAKISEYEIVNGYRGEPFTIRSPKSPINIEFFECVNGVNGVNGWGVNKEEENEKSAEPACSVYPPLTNRSSVHHSENPNKIRGFLRTDGERIRDGIVHTVHPPSHQSTQPSCPKCHKPLLALGKVVGCIHCGALIRQDDEPDPEPTPLMPAPTPEPTPEPALHDGDNYPTKHESALSSETSMGVEPILCPACDEPLTFSDGIAGCVGCGRGWRLGDNGELVLIGDEGDDGGADDGGDSGSDGDDSGLGGDNDGGLGVIGWAMDLLSEHYQPAPIPEPNEHEYQPTLRLTHEPAPITEPTPTNKPPQRLTEHCPNGSIVGRYGDKEILVRPEEIFAVKPIDEIREVSLPNSIKPIPPVIVMDIETHHRNGDILAVGLLMDDEPNIIAKESEKETIAETFDLLRKYCEHKGKVILTGYNLCVFDLPKLIERAEKYGLRCPLEIVKSNGVPIQIKVAQTEGILKGEPFKVNLIRSNIPNLLLVDTFPLVLRWDYVERKLPEHNLKKVVAWFAQHYPNDFSHDPERPNLSPQEIVEKYHKWRTSGDDTFARYLIADLNDTHQLFRFLFPPYWALAQLTGLPIEKLVVKSTAWVWENLLERYYDEDEPRSLPEADEKKPYEGGLVFARRGLFTNCAKIDVASLYPTIMLAYRIRSRKDTKEMMLRWLKALTKRRLDLKEKAKAGDEKAQILQSAMKILINSAYGFLGTGSYPYNDMNAAEQVTSYGRKLLTLIIAALEEAGAQIVEADTDGVIFTHPDPEECLQRAQSSLPNPFRIELEWSGRIVFVSDPKNYIVLSTNGEILDSKGSKWRGRDKPAMFTKFVPHFLQRLAIEGAQSAQSFANSVREEIASGRGWDWVKRTHKVGRGNADKFLKAAGFSEGEIVTYAYLNRKAKTVSVSPEQGYDTEHYLKEFDALLRELLTVINGSEPVRAPLEKLC